MRDSEQKKFIDQYFDTEDFNLVKNDIWLRKRGEFFELRIPIFENGDEPGVKYKEIKGEESIREIFAIPRIESFTEDIARFGYESFFETTGVIEDENFLLERKNILEFLKIKKPYNYQALVEAGIVSK